MRRFFLYSCLMLVSQFVQASDTRYYDVEIIIYENLQEGNRQAEHWAANIDRKIPEMFIELNGEIPAQLTLPVDVRPELNFKQLSVDSFRLSEEAKRIEDSPSRRVLLHTAWVQPGLSQEHSISVHINHALPANDIPSSDISSPSVNQDVPFAVNTLVTPKGNLDALIRVSLARYLHVETNLLLTYPQTDKPAETQGEYGTFDDDMDTGMPAYSDTEEAPATDAQVQAVPNQILIRQDRHRIRSTELHYLDHPLVGVLILFTPHEVPVADAKTSKKSR